ncbi:Vgb family protein [Eudoraea algarum]
MKKICITFAVLALVACSSSSADDPMEMGNSDDTPPVPVLTSITIESSNGNQLDLNSGTTVLTAEGVDQFNNAIAFSSSPQWSSNNSNVSVDEDGNVTAQREGSSIIMVVSGDVQAIFNIVVVDVSRASALELFVSDAGNFDSPPWKILRYDGNGQNPSVFINQNLAWPQDILFLEAEGTVLISNLNSGEITRYDAATGDFIDNFATGISGPTRMKIGADNLLYVLQWSGNGRVLRYQLDGTFVDEFTSVGVNQSIGLDWDSDGNLYVSSFGSAFVKKFDAAGVELETFINSNLQGPTNIWFDDSGDLLVNDWVAGVVQRFDASGSFLNTYLAGLNQPEGIATLPDGKFLIGNGGTGAVKMYDVDGRFISDLVSSGSGGLATPNAIFIKQIN